MNLMNFLASCFTRQVPRDKESIEPNKEIYMKKIQNKLANGGTRSLTLTQGDERDDNLANRDTYGELAHKLSATFRKLNSTDESSNVDDMDTFSESGDSQILSQGDWLQIMRNTTIEYMSSSELINSIRHGIPDELRPMIWEFLTNLDVFRKKYSPDYYQKLKLTDCPAVRYVEKDVPRTYPEHPFFSNDEGHNHLTNVLRAYANHDKEVGYTQGMNYIAATILILLDPSNYKESKLSYFQNYEQDFEEKAFWIFTYILCEKNFRIIYKNELPKFHGMIKALEAKIKIKAPEVFQILKRSDLEISQYFQAQLLSMLFLHTPIEVSKIILDMFFIDEERILFKVLIRSILLCKKEILELEDTMELLNFFNKNLLKTCYEKYKGRLYLLFPGPESAD